MTDLEIMERAKMYVDKMANGINPLTDEAIQEDDFINNVRIARCLFYVSGVLGRVIDNGGEVGSKAKAKKADFCLTAEQLENFAYAENPVSLTVLVGKINELIDDGAMKKLSRKNVAEMLVNAGILEEFTAADGSTQKRPTPAGEALGLTWEHRTNLQGVPYDVVLYNTAAQQFVLDNCCG